MSLRQRAFLAIVLTVGFYALALALMAGLIWVIFQPNVPGRALAFCLFGIAAIAISIIPWPRRFIPPGPLLNPAGQPRLFAELQTVARAVGEEMPAEVYISPEDRKSTRLNSSHANISYAVFCLKKKKKRYNAITQPKTGNQTQRGRTTR